MSREDGIYWDCQCPVFNGCERHGPACDRCWAIGFAWRFGWNRSEKLQRRFGPLVEYNDSGEVEREYDWTGATTFDRSPLLKLARVKAGKVVAFSWYGDWMHKQSIENIRIVLDEIQIIEQHDFLTLTKRPENLLNSLRGWYPIKHLWLGVTAWDQESYNNACKYLSELPGWHTWISLEPMLSPVDITQSDFRPDFLVVGAETGRGAREIDPAKILTVHRQCRTWDVPCWVKHIPDNNGYKYDLSAYRQSPFAQGETNA